MVNKLHLTGAWTESVLRQLKALDQERRVERGVISAAQFEGMQVMPPRTTNGDVPVGISEQGDGMVYFTTRDPLVVALNVVTGVLKADGPKAEVLDVLSRILRD